MVEPCRNPNCLAGRVPASSAGWIAGSQACPVCAAGTGPQLASYAEAAAAARHGIRLAGPTRNGLTFYWHCGRLIATDLVLPDLPGAPLPPEH